MKAIARYLYERYDRFTIRQYKNSSYLNVTNLGAGNEYRIYGATGKPLIGFAILDSGARVPVLDWWKFYKSSWRYTPQENSAARCAIEEI